MQDSAFVIPSFNPGDRLRRVVGDLQEEMRTAGVQVPIVVVDDGSTDGSTIGLQALGVTVVRHETNRGKGAALKTALGWAERRSLSTVVTLDADGQHPACEAVALLLADAPSSTLVLAVRDLAAAGAPVKNQWSNRFSNAVLSLFGGRNLLDTQCGLRRYPVSETIALSAPDDGYSFESDIVLRAARRGLPIIHVPSMVIYPPETERLSYFDSVRDPAKMVFRVVWTTLTVPRVEHGQDT